LAENHEAPLSIIPQLTTWFTALQARTSDSLTDLSIIEQDMHAVDRVIAQRLASGVPLVGSVSQYIIAAGGKRLRPALLLLCCGALQYTGTERFGSGC
jgi:octaprenyl-diphosphate synthase